MATPIKIFYNGIVLTMKSEFDRQFGFVIDQNRIVETFSAAEYPRILRTYPVAPRFNLHAQTVIPGFIISHLHAVAYAFFSQTLSLSPMNLYFDPNYDPPTSSTAVLRRIREYLQQNPPTHGLYVQGYDPILQPGPILNRKDLDQVSATISLAVLTASMHNIYVNTAFLQQWGLISGTQADGSLIFTDKAPLDRRPVFETGSIAESDLFLIGDLFQEENLKERFYDLKMANQILNRKGITTIADAYSPVKEFELYYEYYRTQTATMRLVVFPSHITELSSIPKISHRQIFEKLSMGPIKLILDGSVQGYTASLTHPYFTPPFFKTRSNGSRNNGAPDKTRSNGSRNDSSETWQGEIFFTYESLKTTIQKIIAQQNNIAIHANGDHAIDVLLTVMENLVFEKSVQFLAESPSIRIEHCTTIRPDQIDRLAYINRSYQLLHQADHQLIYPSFLINHVHYYGDRIQDQILGPSAVIDPIATVIDHRLLWDVHSDSPVTPPDPLSMIWTMCTRKTLSGRVMNPEQRITPYAALEGLTRNCAISLGLKDLGTLEPGKLADFAILSANPLEVDVDAIKEIQVIATYLDGSRIESFNNI